MKSSRRRQSTILIIDPQSGKTRSVNVRSSFVGRIGQYAIYLGIVLVTMTGTTIVLSYKNQEKEKRMNSLIQEVSRLNNQPPPPEDTTRAVRYIQGIEVKLKKISQYLQKRGIPGFSYSSTEVEAQKTADRPIKEMYAYYDEYLDRMFSGISHTPVGYPANQRTTTSVFGYRGNPFGSPDGEFHPGLDFKGHKGDAVRSTASGKVIYAGWISGYGNCVRISHRNGYETLYGHLSAITIRKGQSVTANQVIGKIGSTGRSTGYHLHYEVRRANKPLNPRNFLRLN
jgi:murein DD-endopeptidase MepM/ murein hydrolase activator NlpD